MHDTVSRPARLDLHRGLLSLALLCGALALGSPTPAGSDALPAVADTSIRAGMALPRLALTDQHGKPGGVDETTRIVLFASDRESGKLAHAALEPMGGAALAAAGAVYIADISPMPNIITRTLALPKMRKYSYTVLLGREAADTAALPRRPDQVTLLRASAGTITAVEFIGSSDALSRALAQD